MRIIAVDVRVIYLCLAFRACSPAGMYFRKYLVQQLAVVTAGRRSVFVRVPGTTAVVIAGRRFVFVRVPFRTALRVLLVTGCVET